MAWKLREKIPPQPHSIDEMIEGDLAEIISLNLSGAGLERLPNDIDKLVELEELTLSYNELASLPDSLANLSCLKVVDLQGNNLSAVPEAVLALTSLRMLDLSDNYLEFFPSTIDRLRYLNTLWLQGNPLGDLPVEIGNLNLLAFGTSNWSPNVGYILSHLEGLQTLWLVNIGPEATALALTAVQGVTNLYLHENGLTEIPKEAYRLKLETLRVRIQSIIEFPDLRRLKNLSDEAAASTHCPNGSATFLA